MRRIMGVGSSLGPIKLLHGQKGKIVNLPLSKNRGRFAKLNLSQLVACFRFGRFAVALPW